MGVLTTQQKIALLFDLFIHRTDSYLTQWKSDKGVGYERHDAVITPQVVGRHLQGKHTMSVYPIHPDDTVKWLCFDVDVNKAGKTELDDDQRTAETQKITKIVATLLFRLGLPFRVESSGSKGYHLWVFFDQPVPTHKVYDVGHFIQTHIPMGTYVNVEVVPQHREASVVSFSMGMKMPLGIHKKTEQRCFFVDNTFVPYDDQWAVLQKVKKATEAQLDTLIMEHHIVVEEQNTVFEPQAQDYICLSRMMKDGLEDGMRDAGAFQLACYYQAQGIPQDMASILLHEVNNKTDDPLDDYTLEKKLKSAYSKTYYPSPCGEQLIDSYCSTACRRWKWKVRDRWTRYGRDSESAVGVIGHN